MINKLWKSLLPPTKIPSHGGYRMVFYGVCFSEQFWRIIGWVGWEWVLENKASGWIYLEAWASLKWELLYLTERYSKLSNVPLVIYGDEPSGTWTGKGMSSLSFFLRSFCKMGWAGGERVIRTKITKTVFYTVFFLSSG